MLFSRNHQENRRKSATHQQITRKINRKLLTINYNLLFPGGPIPHNIARPLIGPPTLERKRFRAPVKSLKGFQSTSYRFS